MDRRTDTIVAMLAPMLGVDSAELRGLLEQLLSKHSDVEAAAEALLIAWPG